MEIKKLAPTAITAMVLGILSLSFSILVIPGLIMGFIGLAKARQGNNDILYHPDLYYGQGFIKTGRITSIIGIILSLVSILFWAAYIFLLVTLVGY